jgi:tRNA modification GTPase
MVRDGVNVAIIGPPNAGKSSLFNRLLGNDRAIVSELPGTTRDYLEESISISGLLVSLMDTAGIRQSTDFVEAEGVSRALGAANMADITLLVLDCTISPDRESVAEILSQFQHSDKILLALNKVDLIGDHREPCRFSSNGTRISEVFVSALNGDGVDLLREEILNLAIGASLLSDTGVRVTSQRHAEALGRAKNHLEVSLMSLESGASNEFVAMDVRSAAEAVGEITGEVTTEEILNSVFSKFCVGK